MLKPGGRLAVTTWGDGDARWSWYGELLRRFPSAVRTAPPILQSPTELASAVREAGFTRVRVATEVLEVVYQSEAEWWASLWSRGERAVIEGMEPEVRDAFRAAALRRLQPLRQTHGFHQQVRVLVATAALPGGDSTTADPERQSRFGP